VAPGTITINCGSIQLITIDGGGPVLPRNIGGNSAPAGVNLHTFPAMPECSTLGRAPFDELLSFMDFSATGLGRKILGNKDYIEGILQTVYPDIYATLGGDHKGIHTEIITTAGTTADSGGVHMEFIMDMVFTVDPAFVALNGGESAAGSVRMTKRWGVTVDGEVLNAVNVVANPVRPIGVDAFTAEEYHFTADDLSANELSGAPSGVSTLRAVVYKAPVNEGQEYELGFKKAPCWDDYGKGLMTTYYSSRLRGDGPLLSADEHMNPYGPWFPSSVDLNYCLLKEMNKNLRGHEDHLRRKLMDLAGDDVIVVESLFGSHGGPLYIAGYYGVYECDRDLLAALLGATGP
jgi:hypothetical protein